MKPHNAEHFFSSKESSQTWEWIQKNSHENKIEPNSTKPRSGWNFLQPEMAMHSLTNALSGIFSGFLATSNGIRSLETQIYLVISGSDLQCPGTHQSSNKKGPHAFLVIPFRRVAPLDRTLQVAFTLIVVESKESLPFVADVEYFPLPPEQNVQEKHLIGKQKSLTIECKKTYEGGPRFDGFCPIFCDSFETLFPPSEGMFFP